MARPFIGSMTPCPTCNHLLDHAGDLCPDCEGDRARWLFSGPAYLHVMKRRLMGREVSPWWWGNILLSAGLGVPIRFNPTLRSFP
jgi:hypothetical protein